MQFRRSAGLFLLGFWLAFGGAVVTWFGAMTAISSSNSYFSDGPSGGSVFAMFLGGAAGLAGFICLALAVHRALSKIDALHVPVQQQHAPHQMPYPPSYPPAQGQNYQP
ncbi:hypothetical protein M1D89_19505 [Arthrobacter sp. D3-18]